jgi:hypothetical protein
MASMTFRPRFTVELDSPEMRLVILALTGRIDFKHENGKDQAAAIELGNQLFAARAQQTSDYGKAHQPKPDQPAQEGA